jgi:hypothetical protein
MGPELECGILGSTRFIGLHTIYVIETELSLIFTVIVRCATIIALSELGVNQRESPNRVWAHGNTSTDFGEAFCRLIDLV